MTRQSQNDLYKQMCVERDTVVLEAAIQEAKEQGYQWITRARVADRAKVSVGTVSNAYGRMIDLKRAVLRAAIQREILEIVAQGVAEKSPIALDAPLELRAAALAVLK